MLYSQHEVQQRFIGLARQVANNLLAERKNILAINSLFSPNYSAITSHITYHVSHISC